MTAGFPLPRSRFCTLRSLLPALALLGSGCEKAPTGPPNVLLISIDSLRPDHLGCYGYRSPTGVATSPRLDRLAEEGVLFENAVSTTSWTLPSHHALFSGLPDLLHGAVDDLHGPTPDREVLAASLGRRGYATAGFFTGPYLQAAYGFAEGFDRYQNVTARAMPFDFPVEERPDLVELEREFHEVVTSDRLTRIAVDYLTERAGAQDTPFFLFLHYFDVHYDYRPPEQRMADQFHAAGGARRLTGDYFLENQEIRDGMPAADLADVISFYDGEVFWVDQKIGEVLDALDHLRLAANTLVVVVSDHGDEFFEHGEKGHRNNLHDSTLRAAMLWRWPGYLPEGARVGPVASLADVAPTLLDLVDGAREDPGTDAVRAAGETRFHGESLRPWMDGTRSDPREALGYLFDSQDPAQLENHWALWTGRHKVIVRQLWQENSGRQRARRTTGEVYDLAADPEERNNLAGSREPAVQEVIRRYEEVHQRLYQRTASLRAGPGPAFDEEERERMMEQLRELGYVGPTTVHEQPPPPPFPEGGG